MTPRQEYIPRPFGVEAARFLLTRPRAGLLLPVGLGKTSITLLALSLLFNSGLAKRALVICPIRAIRNVWMEEMQKWQEFAHLTWGDLRADLSGPPADLEFCSPSVLEKVLNSSRPGWDVLIIDESTDFKNARTQRFKNLRKHLRRFKFRWLLTGSPSPNGLLDLWAPTYILDEGAALGKYITHYRSNYFQSDYMGWNWTLRPGMEEKIHAAVKHLYFRVEAKDSGLVLPQLLPNRILVDLPTVAARQYREMEEEFFTIIENEGLASPNAGAAGIKLRQIANGQVYAGRDKDGKRRVVTVHGEKIAALKALVDEQLGAPLLVFYEFNCDAAAIQAALPGTPNLSDADDEQSAKLVRLFNEGKIPVLLGQEAGVSKALNLQQACAAVCFFSPTWNLLNYEQGVGRVWRQGNPFPAVVVHQIVARGTRDERAEEAVVQKGATQQRLNNALSKR